MAPIQTISAASDERRWLVLYRSALQSGSSEDWARFNEHPLGPPPNTPTLPEVRERIAELEDFISNRYSNGLTDAEIKGRDQLEALLKAQLRSYGDAWVQFHEAPSVEAALWIFECADTYMLSRSEASVPLRDWGAEVPPPVKLPPVLGYELNWRDDRQASAQKLYAAKVLQGVEVGPSATPVAVGRRSYV